MTNAVKQMGVTGTPITKYCSLGIRKKCFAADKWIVCGV